MSDPVYPLPAAPVAVVAKSANPGPLGLAAFGLTTVVLSAINAHLLPHEAVPIVVPPSSPASPRTRPPQAMVSPMA